MAEFYPYQPDKHPPLIQPVKQASGNGQQQVVEGGVGDALLKRIGIEIGIAYLYRYARSEFLFLPASQASFSTFLSSRSLIMPMSMVSCSKVVSLLMDLCSE